MSTSFGTIVKIRQHGTFSWKQLPRLKKVALPKVKPSLAKEKYISVIYPSIIDHGHIDSEGFSFSIANKPSAALDVIMRSIHKVGQPGYMLDFHVTIPNDGIYSFAGKIHLVDFGSAEPEKSLEVTFGVHIDGSFI